MATIEVKNDYMLGRQNETILYEKCIELEIKIDKAIEILKDTSVDMPSTLLIETIDYARHILGDKDGTSNNQSS